MSFTSNVNEVKRVTETIDRNEKCWGVLDVDLMVPLHTGFHRYRLTYVIRQDKPTAYVEDLTADGRYSKLGTHPTVQVFTLLEHTVAEAWDITDAAYDTNAKQILRDKEAEAKEHSIVTDYWRNQEKLHDHMHRNPVSTESSLNDARRQ